MNRRRIISTLFAVLVASSLLFTSCVKTDNTGSTTTGQTETQKTSQSQATDQEPKVDTKLTGGLKLPFSDQKIELTWSLSEHPSYPINIDQWDILKKIEEWTNVKIVLQPIPDAGYADKIAIMLASNNLPDIFSPMVSDIFIAGAEGQLLEVNKYMGEFAPNISRVFKEEPDLKAGIISSEGKLFAFPQIKSTEPTHAWLVRKDILDKENLKWPEKMDEFIELCRTLKVKYPDVVPYTTRAGADGKVLTKFQTAYDTYVDPDNLVVINNGKAEIALENPMSKRLVEDVYTLYKEGLMDQDYPLVTASMWEERLLIGKAFFSMDWGSRANSLNKNSKKAEKPIEGYEIDRYLPPIPEGGTGNLPGVSALNNYCNAISAKVKYPEVAVQLLDYLYSPQGAELMTWGIEGVDYIREENGARKNTAKISTWDNPDGISMQEFGMRYNNICAFTDITYEDRLITSSPQNVEWVKLYQGLNRVTPPQPSLPTTSEELEKWVEIYPGVQKYFIQNVDKFIMGMRPISEWDQFIQELKKLGMDELVNIKQTQYDRASK